MTEICEGLSKWPGGIALSHKQSNYQRCKQRADQQQAKQTIRGTIKQTIKQTIKKTTQQMRLAHHRNLQMRQFVTMSRCEDNNQTNKQTNQNKTKQHKENKQTNRMGMHKKIQRQRVQ